MKIVITSDTHLPKKGRGLPSPLLADCTTADLIIHAGDWSTMEVYQQLSSYAPVKGVYGNIDSDEIIERFPARELLEIEGMRIGIVHGDGDKKSTERRALDAFETPLPDVIIFGHSHIPYLRYFKKTLLINPGSPTDKRVLPFFSYGILTVLDGGMKTEIVYFK